MSVQIVKALKTYLKSPLTSSASSVVLRKFVDTKGNELSLSDFGGSWFVIVVKQGDTIEMIKCNAISQSGSDTSATLTVATNGRNLDPTSPYAGYSTGQSFQSGAEVIVTNDPLTIMQFGNLNNAQTWALLQTFTLAPKSNTDAVASDELVRKSQLDAAVLGDLTLTPVVVPATAGETLAVDRIVFLNTADGEWYEADADTAAEVENVVLGITRGTGTDGNAINGGVTILGAHDASSALFTANTPYFASNTAGDFATSAGTKEVSLGFAISTTRFYLYPRYNQQITEDQQDALAGSSGTPSGSNKYITEDDVAADGTADKIVRATGGALPPLSAENLTNLKGANDSMTAGATISGATLPVPVYRKSSDGEVYACDGNDQTTLDFLGFATSDGTDGNPITVQLNGIVSGFSGLTAGARYYVSDTAGVLSTTRGTYEIYVGRAISATEIFIEAQDEQYIGSQSISVGGLTVPTDIQGLWRKIIVAGSGDGGSNTGEVHLYRIGKTSGSHVVYIGGAPNFALGFSASISGTTLTIGAVGNSSAVSGTAYYFK